jgi:hypothetical protein
MARSGAARADSGRTRLIHAVFDGLLTLCWVSAVSVKRFPSCSPGNGILRAETAGRIQARSTAERPEFGSQTGLRLANLPELPAGLIDQQHGVRSRRDLGGDFGEMEVHRLRVAAWHDQGRALAVLGTDRAEDISRGGSLIFGSAWTRAALGPAPGDLVLLPDARLVGEPDLYGAGLDVLLAPDRFQARGKAFLKSSIAPVA